MKKVLDELYKLKFDLHKEIRDLKRRQEIEQPNTFEDGERSGKREGRITAKEFDLLRIDQIIHEILK